MKTSYINGTYSWKTAKKLLEQLKKDQKSGRITDLDAELEDDVEFGREVKIQASYSIVKKEKKNVKH